MPAYQIKYQTVTVADYDYKIRSLLDLQQYADPGGESERAGLSPANWPLFGQVWPSARVLALEMDSFDLDGKRILEIGAGLGLASLVIHRREGDITVSDWHPLSGDFLKQNLSLNDLPPLEHQNGNWTESDGDLGLFDLIIGSDILYERQQEGLLSAFIDRHAADSAEVIIVDPDRGNRTEFCRQMAELGYQFSSSPAERFLENGEPYKGRFLNFTKESS